MPHTTPRSPALDAMPGSPALDVTPGSPALDATPRSPAFDAMPRSHAFLTAPRSSARHAVQLFALLATLFVTSSAAAQRSPSAPIAPSPATPPPATPPPAQPEVAPPPVLAPGNAAGATTALSAAGFQLRPIDRATVRVFALTGVGTRLAEGRSSHQNRLIAIARAGHGSGVVIRGDGLILTARHVVQSADPIAVVFPGQSTAVPARVVYVDPDDDLAFLSVAGPVADFVPLPDAAPTLTASQRVSVSGYPLDPRERFPAAASGDVSRMNNDGRIQLSISVNPGNSGGPVIDADGNLIAIVSERGEPEAGVAGIALVEPIRAALDDFRADVAGLPPQSFTAADARLAQIVVDFLRIDPDATPYDPAAATRALEAAREATLAPEASALVAAHAWNLALVLLETNRAADWNALRPELHTAAAELVRAALALATRALEQAPYLRDHYGFARFLLRIAGRAVAPALPPIDQRGRLQGATVPMR